MPIDTDLRRKERTCMSETKPCLCTRINFNHGRLTTITIGTRGGTQLSSPSAWVETILAPRCYSVLSGASKFLESEVIKRFENLSFLVLINTLTVDNETLEEDCVSYDGSNTLNTNTAWINLTGVFETSKGYTVSGCRRSES